ncbi:MAG: hypothetical protein ABH858_02940, partial [Candidatus Omnitrophota bacterium]
MTGRKLSKTGIFKSGVKVVKVGRKKTGQASAELAICGSMFVFVLATLIQYGVKFNFQQEMKMKTFRAALKKASSDSVMASYLNYSEVNIKDVPVPDINHPGGGSNLSEMVDMASATRTYFMQAAPAPSEANMARTHITINDKQRHEYDAAHGYQADGITPKDGFTQSGIYPSAVSIKTSTPYGSGFPAYEIIRAVSDPKDQLPAGGGDGIYWTWIKIVTTKNRLHVQKDAHGLQTKESIKDILKTTPDNLTNQGEWKTRTVDDGDGTKEEQYFDPNPNYGFYGEVYNLGPGMNLYDRVYSGQLFAKVEDLPVISQGTRINPDSLVGTFDERYKIFVEQINGGDDAPVSSLTVQSSVWGEINPSETMTTADGKNTMRGTSTQGLVSDRVTERQDYYKIVNAQNDESFTTRTEVMRS